MIDRAELVAALRAYQLQRRTEAADQIEADGKRIAELLDVLESNNAIFAKVESRIKAADTRALAAAEAVKEAAAKTIELYDDATMNADNHMLDSTECAGIIRALDCNAIVKGMK